MTIIDAIKGKNILNSDNDIRIDEAVLKKNSKKLNISFVLTYAIDYDTYMNLKKTVEDIFLPLGLSLDFSFGYEDETLTEEELKGYLAHILEELYKKASNFKSLQLSDSYVTGNEIEFLVAYDALGVEELCPKVEEGFAEYGLNVKVFAKKDEEKSIQAQIEALDSEIEETLSKQRQEAIMAKKFNKEVQEQKKYRRTSIPDNYTPIKAIPITQSGLQEYLHTKGEAIFRIKGYVFALEVKDLAKSSLLTIKITDETDSIVVSKWLRGEKEKDLYLGDNGIKVNSILDVTGNAQFDTYSDRITLNANNIQLLGVHHIEEVMDDAPVKRVELHCHTKMSNMDGITDAKDYIELVNKWGWKSMAFTDHNGCYAIPDVDHAIAKMPDFKPIYGTELSLVEDDQYFITFNEKDIPLRDATYVVFDIETTGLSQSYDEIIEIAAHKVRGGTIVDSYEVFINPLMHIPEKITELTSITDDMVKDAKTIDIVLPEFLEFCKDTILVAHNAKFDVGMIYRDMKRLGIEAIDFPVIDSLNLFRVGYHDEVKGFGLKFMCKYFKVKQEHHHRATDDTRVTALCFIQMLQDLYNKKIENYKDINSTIDPNTHFRYVIPYHIVLIAKTPLGYKNMFKILSDAMTNHMWENEARVLKSVIESHREGILLSSGCANGKVFEMALNRSEEELREAISYYDYIEVQPPLAYKQYYVEFPDPDTRIKEVIQKIIRISKEMGKIVVATSDCHYLRPRLKRYRDILIEVPQIGGGVHPLKRAFMNHSTPEMHLRTTNEMLEEFAFLGKDLAYEIVVTNTNLIADSIEKWPAFHKEMYAPRDDEFKNNFLHVESIEAETRRIVNETCKELYGENPHPIVKKRLDHELHCIISNGYASIYYICHLMVKKSLEDGYLVGSRGSVGSSLVATMMNISEINPLAPHYRCKKCHFHTFKMRKDEIEEFGLTDLEKPFQEALQKVDSGYDLDDAICPVCGAPLSKDGHDIPFETFLGFNGDKTPDIDLNFSGEYQAQAHEYVRTVFGPENAFRAGTVATIADKNAYGYVKGFCERQKIEMRDCEMDRVGSYLIGVKRSTGQHPGGIVVVPHHVDIFDVTPVQFPADNIENPWRTTHFDYHSFEQNLLKFDILGHDDPTLIKYFMDYVKEHQEDFPFTKPQDIPIDDKNLYRLFYDPSVIGVTPEDIDSKVASFAVPELRTNFVRGMLIETLPSTFAELVKISGLSHGTNVWNNNAQELIKGTTEFGALKFKDLIGCRDDIMVQLMQMGLDPLKSFKIMEFVRKNKKTSDMAGWLEYQKYMREHNVPEWYIWSCDKIEYMFPKAHATAYCMMSLRIAWFKVYAPTLFYSAWFSKRAKNHVVHAYLGGKMAIRAAMDEIMSKSGRTATDDDKYTALQVALECVARKINFLPVSISKSSASIFEPEGKDLRIPFSAVDSLGEAIAIDIVEKRNQNAFTSKKDVLRRTRLSQTLYDEFDVMHYFDDLPEEDPIKEEGLFALL